MKQKQTKINVIQEIRWLVDRYSHKTLENCMSAQINSATNQCYCNGSHEEKVNLLAKAAYVSNLMSKGLPISQAIRKLGARMRVAQSLG